jgi:CheY-like chemotaxis protein
VVLIDDDEELLESMRQLMARDGHEVLTASRPADGIALVRKHRPQLVLLDYFMPEMTGAGVVRAIREFDQLVQVLLVTGYAEEQPGRRLIRELDIQGYHDKGDGPERLLVLADAALKHFRVVDRLESQRQRLVHLLESGPAITRLQPAEALFRIALANLSGLLDTPRDALVATSNNGLFIMADAQEGVSFGSRSSRLGRAASSSPRTGSRTPAG